MACECHERREPPSLRSFRRRFLLRKCFRRRQGYGGQDGGKESYGGQDGGQGARGEVQRGWRIEDGGAASTLQRGFRRPAFASYGEASEDEDENDSSAHQSTNPPINQSIIWAAVAAPLAGSAALPPSFHLTAINGPLCYAFAFF